MSSIIVSNLTFGYDGSVENIFDNVSFSIDTSWKLGFIGRNGKGKTTFLKILMGKLNYQGKIITDVSFDYFPFDVNNNLSSYEIASIDYWKLDKEVSLLYLSPKVLNRPFKTLSNGEQTKVMLAILFLKNNNFLLIDEPTNHLDRKARLDVAKYLNSKHGFILVSHDRKLLDACTDHILSINKTNIEVEKGNFSSWWENKERRENFESLQNEKLEREINHLDKASKQTKIWSNKVEISKNQGKTDHFIDKGYIGHMAAKMMKRSKVIESHKERDIEAKSKLLQNVEEVEVLKIFPQNYHSNRLLEINHLSISYNERNIFNDLNFYLENNERIELRGKNGSGKSSLLKLIMGYNIKHDGELYIPKDLVISYVEQDTSSLRGTFKNFIFNNQIDEVLFKSILRKLGFDRIIFDKNLEDLSEGQKKKILIAKSLCQKANLYIWDEPLNYIDIYSRIQIEDLILKYKPTMIFVEHDETFSEKIATKIIDLDKWIYLIEGEK